MQTLKKVKYLTDEDGNKHSVVIPVQEYEDMLEDIQDLVSVAERKDESSISLDEVLKNLKDDGYI